MLHFVVSAGIRKASCLWFCLFTPTTKILTFQPTIKWYVVSSKFYTALTTQELCLCNILILSRNKKLNSSWFTNICHQHQWPRAARFEVHLDSLIDFTDEKTTTGLSGCYCWDSPETRIVLCHCTEKSYCEWNQRIDAFVSLLDNFVNIFRWLVNLVVVISLTWAFSE